MLTGLAGRMTVRRAALLTAVLSILLYLPSAWNGFAYDDNLVIRFDQRIHDLADAPRILLQPYWLIENLGLYRPLASLSYAVDWAISGGTPAWFHIVNILWNALACVLVVVLLAQFVPVPFALAGGLVFAVHPVHTEAVANIVGRAELMAAAFMTAAMIHWVRRDAAAGIGPRRLLGVAALYLFALASKESAVMLPALLALCDAATGTLRPGTGRAWLRRHGPALATFAIVATAWLALRAHVLGSIGPTVLDPLFDVATTRPERIMTALQAWPEYVRLLFFPLVLMADYGPPYLGPALTVTPAAITGFLILTALVAGGAAAFARGYGRAAFVLLFMPIALLPTSNLIIPIGVIVAERTLYLPSLALAAAVAFTLPMAATYTARRRAAVALTAVCILFAGRTLHRIPEWDSTDTVLAALLRDQPDSFRGHWYFADVAREEGRPAVALKHYAHALRTWPFRKSFTLTAAVYAAEHGDTAMALQITGFGVERWPEDVRFIRLKAAILLDTGRAGEARPLVERGLALAPADSTLLAMRRALAPGAP
jgi:tetratricopeptide (TPR) repeat protein